MVFSGSAAATPYHSRKDMLGGSTHLWSPPSRPKTPLNTSGTLRYASWSGLGGPAESPKSPKSYLATSPSRAVPKLAHYRPALILSCRHCMFNDFDYHPVVKTIYSGRGPSRTTTSAAKLSR